MLISAPQLVFEPSTRQSAVWPVVVLGAGAAGLMAALFAARSGARTLVLESRPQPGAKIRISGGGRCNVLPCTAGPEHFFTSGSRHTLRNLLAAWPLADVVRFFETELGLALKAEPTGKLFPRSDRAQEVIDVLNSALRMAGATLRFGARAVHITKSRQAGFDVKLADGSCITARRLVLATGGLSVPKTGSDGAGWRMAAALGHRLQAPYAALVPLLSDNVQLQSLRGLSCGAQLQAWRGNHMLGSAAGDFLFTHRGYSGPVVLNISRYVSAGYLDPCPAAVQVRACWHRSDGGTWAQAWQQSRGGTAVGPWLRAALPRRLADVLVSCAAFASERRLGELTRLERLNVERLTEAFVLPISGHDGFRTAEVTAGGIGLDQVHAKTLESRLHAGLHFAGETLDVTGALGGYNFLWAWVSGRRAGQAAGRL